MSSRYILGKVFNSYENPENTEIVDHFLQTVPGLHQRPEG